MLPKEPMILLSYLNTQLRDRFPSWEELVSDLEMNEEMVLKTLSDVGYVYNENLNRFVKK